MLSAPLASNSPRLAMSRRRDFPVFVAEQCGRPLHYLDNAATTQKPQVVLDALTRCYTSGYAPIHRGLYPLAAIATESYEDARATLSRYFGAASASELVFTRSATDAINLVAEGWARPRLGAGDRIWVSRMEHHANYLPWQRVCRVTGAELCIIELTEDGGLDWQNAEGLFDRRTRLIALTQVSNVLGIENPLEAICTTARERRIAVLVDGAQSVGHLPIDLQSLGCDFFACSAHKMYGPAGIGLLYGQSERLAEMQPLLVGGGMVDRVGEGVEASEWIEAPGCFEAGSPNLPGAVGFAVAADYLRSVDLWQAHQRELGLARAAARALAGIKGVRLTLTDDRIDAPLFSFTIDGIHPHDIAQVAGEAGVAIRAGHHCAQPLMRHLGVDATARVSFGLYNDEADVDALCQAVERAAALFS